MEDNNGKCEERTWMSSPWATYCHKLQALLGDDPDIDVRFEDETCTVKLLVNGTDKAEALEALLPAVKNCGGKEVCVKVIPANRQETPADLLKAALFGNPNFAFIQKVEGAFSNTLTYVVFKKKVAQYWNDNLGDLHGNENTLYQELAKELFEAGEGVLYCTDTEE